MLSRRHFLLGGLAVPAFGLATSTRASDEAFMARALQLAHDGAARGDGTPYGAVVVRQGVIVGEGWNRSYVLHDATAHAETEAIRDAARRLVRRDLTDCLLYTNGGRPCPMCETASYWARIGGLRLEGPGGAVIDGGGPRYGGC